jgi:uncharacterized protein with HEPN domain
VIKRSERVRLHDMLENIDTVIEMTAGVELGAYRGDIKLKRAVERCVEIISEASKRVSDSLKNQFADQPWPEIAAIGNLLRHDYERIDDLIMWKIARQSLPALRTVVVAMLKKSE